MLIHIAVQIEKRESRTLTAELAESVQKPENETLRLLLQAGCIILEIGLVRVADLARLQYGNDRAFNHDLKRLTVVPH